MNAVISDPAPPIAANDLTAAERSRRQAEVVAALAALLPAHALRARIVEMVHGDHRRLSLAVEGV